jgi:hypothetical protein
MNTSTFPMQDKKRKVVSFQVTTEQLEAIDAAALKTGLSRSEYLRTRALADSTQAAESQPEPPAAIINSAHSAPDIVADTGEAGGVCGRKRWSIAMPIVAVILTCIVIDAVAYVFWHRIGPSSAQAQVTKPLAAPAFTTSSTSNR